MMHCQIHWKQEESIHFKTDGFDLLYFSLFLWIPNLCGWINNTTLHKYTSVSPHSAVINFLKMVNGPYLNS